MSECKHEYIRMQYAEEEFMCVKCGEKIYYNPNVNNKVKKKEENYMNNLLKKWEE